MLSLTIPSAFEGPPGFGLKHVGINEVSPLCEFRTPAVLLLLPADSPLRVALLPRHPSAIVR